MRGISLAEAALLSTMPSFGMVVTLIGRGYVLDASGRLATGWFPAEQRSLAMGIRHTAQPLRIALAALVLPELGERSVSVALFSLRRYACCQRCCAPFGCRVTLAGPPPPETRARR